MNRYPDARILVLCKAPVPGAVKSRLAEAIGDVAACDVHETLARQKIELCRDAGLARVELWCAPDIDQAFFQSFADVRLGLFLQRGQDLGARMSGAIDDALARGAQRVVLIGTDCPMLDVPYLERAIEALADHEAVIGPAEDGGYGLIGLRASAPRCFEGISWGTDTVCAATCVRFNELRLRFALLPLLWDVDREADLIRWRAMQEG